MLEALHLLQVDPLAHSVVGKKRERENKPPAYPQVSPACRTVGETAAGTFLIWP